MGEKIEKKIKKGGSVTNNTDPPTSFQKFMLSPGTASDNPTKIQKIMRFVDQSRVQLEKKRIMRKEANKLIVDYFGKNPNLSELIKMQQALVQVDCGTESGKYQALTNVQDTIEEKIQKHDMSLDSLVNILQMITKQKDKGELRNLNHRTLEHLGERILSKLRLKMDPLKTAQILFDTWALESYEEHMKSHCKVIEEQFKTLILLDKAGLLRDSSENRPVLCGTIFEMSSGTGSMLQILYENLSEEIIRKSKFIANEVSPHMLRIASEKLSRYNNPPIFESYDMRNFPKTGSHKNNSCDIIILAQTLHLITDPVEQEREKDPNFIVDKTDHRMIKEKVIQKAFDMLKWGGHFILIDEWPPLLSDRTGENPIERIIANLFKEIFRPIATREIFKEAVMQNIPGSRLVIELKNLIDKEHAMYMMLYEKNRRKYNFDLLEDRQKENLHEYSAKTVDIEQAKKAAILHILKEFIMINEEGFSERINRNDCLHGLEFHTMGKGAILNPSKEKLRGKNYSTIIFSQKTHEMSASELHSWMRDAVNSLKKGGFLIIIDESSAPSGSKFPKERSWLRYKILDRHYQNQLKFMISRRKKISDEYESEMCASIFKKVI